MKINIETTILPFCNFDNYVVATLNTCSTIINDVFYPLITIISIKNTIYKTPKNKSLHFSCTIADNVHTISERTILLQFLNQFNCHKTVHITYVIPKMYVANCRVRCS